MAMSRKEVSDHLDKMLQHESEVAAGLIPADSPPDFVYADWKPGPGGVPGWFGPGFRQPVVIADDPELTPAGVRIELDWEFFDHDQPTRLTRQWLNATALEQEAAPVLPIWSSELIPPPDRIWSQKQMARLRLGLLSAGTGDPWDVFMEGDRAFVHHAATGFGRYEAQFAVCRDGWRIVEACVQSDPECYFRRSDSFESVHLEIVLFGNVLKKLDVDLGRRFDREARRADQGPRFVITEAKGVNVPIKPPQHWIAHGHFDDLHPFQMMKYKEAFTRGFLAALTALMVKGRDEQDVFYAAHRHQKQATETPGIESLQHAGLANGARMAAYQHFHGEIGLRKWGLAI
jgi:hypothetical protein